MLVIDIENPERHAHYWQASCQLSERFGCDVILADTGCRLLGVEAKVNMERAKTGLEHAFRFGQSMLHGSFHPWYCLVQRGRPWLHDLGCVTGEEAERIFAFTRHLKASLQESSLGRRYRVLDIMCWLRNQCKTEVMAKFLSARAKRVGKAFVDLVQEAVGRTGPKMTEEELNREIAQLQVRAIAVF